MIKCRSSLFGSTQCVMHLLHLHQFLHYENFQCRCEELVGRLLVAYDTQTGIPYNSIVLDTLEVQNPTWTRRSSTLSEFGSEQLEFAKLSMHSGNPIYNEKAESVIQYLYDKYPEKVNTLHARSGCRHTVCCLSEFDQHATRQHAIKWITSSRPIP